MQIKVTRWFVQGSSFGFAYTWSRAIDYSDNEDLSSLSFPYPTYWEKNRAATGFDRTNNLEVWGSSRSRLDQGSGGCKVEWAAISLAAG
jgi:hypothetical protein